MNNERILPYVVEVTERPLGVGPRQVACLQYLVL
jgi:hypothetical protein